MQRKNRVLLRKIIFGGLVVLACRGAGSETLDYRLAYRGLFTLFIWKELADVQLTAEADTLGRCELAMRLTTQDHPLAEAVRPTRYLWWSRSRPGEARREGFMRVWFSDDERRLPLRFRIRGRVGALEVTIRPESLEAQGVPAACRPSEKR